MLESLAIAERANVAGAGINVARRAEQFLLMDFLH
jgi:hypothetical protein